MGPPIPPLPEGLGVFGRSEGGRGILDDFEGVRGRREGGRGYLGDLRED